MSLSAFLLCCCYRKRHETLPGEWNLAEERKLFALSLAFTIHCMIHSFVSSFLYRFLHSFLHSFIPSCFICLFIASYLHLFLHSFLHSLILSFLHWSFSLFFLSSFEIPPFLRSFFGFSLAQKVIHKLQNYLVNLQICHSICSQSICR